MSSIVLTTVTGLLLAAPFWGVLEITGMLVVRFRAGVADVGDASEVVFDEVEALKEPKSSGDP